MQLTKGAIGNLVNKYRAVLKKCTLMNVFGTIAIAGMVVAGSCSDVFAYESNTTVTPTTIGSNNADETINVTISDELGKAIDLSTATQNFTLGGDNSTITVNFNKDSFTSSRYGIYSDESGTFTINGSTLNIVSNNSGTQTTSGIAIRNNSGVSTNYKIKNINIDVSNSDTTYNVYRTVYGIDIRGGNANFSSENITVKSSSKGYTAWGLRVSPNNSAGTVVFSGSNTINITAQSDIGASALQFWKANGNSSTLTFNSGIITLNSISTDSSKLSATGLIGINNYDSTLTFSDGVEELNINIEGQGTNVLKDSSGSTLQNPTTGIWIQDSGSGQTTINAKKLNINVQAGNPTSQQINAYKSAKGITAYDLTDSSAIEFLGGKLDVSSNTESSLKDYGTRAFGIKLSVNPWSENSYASNERTGKILGTTSIDVQGSTAGVGVYVDTEKSTLILGSSGKEVSINAQTTGSDGPSYGIIVINKGTLTLDGNTTISANTSNAFGSYDIHEQNTATTTDAKITNTGTMTVNAKSFGDYQGTLTNSGTINLSSSTTWTNFSTIENTGTIVGTSLVNYDTTASTGGKIKSSGTLTLNGTGNITNNLTVDGTGTNTPSAAGDIIVNNLTLPANSLLSVATKTTVSGGKLIVDKLNLVSSVTTTSSSDTGLNTVGFEYSGGTVIATDSINVKAGSLSFDSVSLDGTVSESTTGTGIFTKKIAQSDTGKVSITTKAEVKDGGTLEGAALLVDGTGTASSAGIAAKELAQTGGAINVSDVTVSGTGKISTTSLNLLSDPTTGTEGLNAKTFTQTAGNVAVTGDDGITVASGGTLTAGEIGLASTVNTTADGVYAKALTETGGLVKATNITVADATLQATSLVIGGTAPTKGVYVSSSLILNNSKAQIGTEENPVTPTIDSTGTIDVQDGVAYLGDVTTENNKGIIKVNTGKESSATSLALSGADKFVTYASATSAGQVGISGTLNVEGTLDLGAKGTATADGTINAGTLKSSGAATLSAGTYTVASALEGEIISGTSNKLTLAETESGSISENLTVSGGSVTVAEGGTWTLSSEKTISLTDGNLIIDADATLDTKDGTLANSKVSTASTGIVIKENGNLWVDYASIFDSTSETPTLVTENGITKQIYNAGTITIYNASSENSAFITAKGIDVNAIDKAKSALMLSGSTGSIVWDGLSADTSDLEGDSVDGSVADNSGLTFDETVSYDASSGTAAVGGGYTANDLALTDAEAGSEVSVALNGDLTLTGGSESTLVTANTADGEEKAYVSEVAVAADKTLTMGNDDTKTGSTLGEKSDTAVTDVSLGSNSSLVSNGTGAEWKVGDVTGDGTGSVETQGTSSLTTGKISDVGSVSAGEKTTIEASTISNVDTLSAKSDSTIKAESITDAGSVNADGGSVEVAQSLTSEGLSVENSGKIEAKSIATNGSQPVTLDGTVSSTSGNVTLKSSADISEAKGSITANGGSLSVDKALTAAESGSLSLTGDTGVTLKDVTASAASTVNVTANSGNVDLKSTLAAEEGAALSVEAAQGNVSVTDAVSATSADIAVNAQSVEVASLSASKGSSTDSKGSIEVTATEGNVTVSGEVAAKADATVSLTAEKGDITLSQAATGTGATLNIAADQGTVTANAGITDAASVSAGTILSKGDVSAESVSAGDGGIKAMSDEGEGKALSANVISTSGDVTAGAIQAGGESNAKLSAGNVTATSVDITGKSTSPAAISVSGEMKSEGAVKIANATGEIGKLTTGGVKDSSISEGSDLTIGDLDLGEENHTKLTIGAKTEEGSSSRDDTTVTVSGTATLGDNDLDILNATVEIAALDATSPGGIIFIDPAYVKIDSFTDNTLAAGLIVATGSTVKVGTSLSDSALKEVLTEMQIKTIGNTMTTKDQAILVVTQPITLDARGLIVVDSNATGATYDSETGEYTLSGSEDFSSVEAGNVYFANNSLFVVDATNLTSSKAAITAGARTDGGSAVAVVGKEAQLKILNLKNTTESVGILEGFVLQDTDGNTGEDAQIGWLESAANLTTDDRMLTASAAIEGNDVVLNTSVRSASDVLPGLSSDLNGTMHEVWANGKNDVNSSQGGIRFLSRAANEGYMPNARDGAKAIESVARFAVLGGVPQMTFLASEAAAGAVTERTSIASPLSSKMQTMASDGSMSGGATGDGYKNGFGMWVMPLYQSYNAFGMEGGNMDLDVSGRIGGIALGADYTWNDSLRAGVTFNVGGGFAEGSGDLKSTENSMNFWGIGAYLGWAMPVSAGDILGATFDINYTETFNSLEQSDTGVGMGKTKSDINAYAVSLGIRGEYKMHLDALDITPHVGVRYTYLHTSEYDVKAGGTKILKGDAMNQDIWSFPVGVTFSKDFMLNEEWYMRPSIDVQIVPRAGDVKARGDVRFTGVGTKAEMESQMLDYVTYGGRIGLEFGNDTLKIGVNYAIQHGASSTSHGVFGTVRVEF